MTSRQLDLPVPLDQHLRPLQGHPAGHDQSDVPRTQNHRPASHQAALYVQIPLGGSGSQYAGRAISRGSNCASGALPAAHSQDHRAGGQLPAPHDRIHCLNPQHIPVPNVQHHGVGKHLDVRLPQQPDKPARVFRAGQLLLKVMKPKPVMDALIQDAAQLPVPFQNQNPPKPRLPGGEGGGQPGRPAAHHNQIINHFKRPRYDRHRS